jgi:hypothetical protein
VGILISVIAVFVSIFAFTFCLFFYIDFLEYKHVQKLKAKQQVQTPALTPPPASAEPPAPPEARP